MKLSNKIGGALLAVAFVAGAVPGTVSSALAVETGQMLDKGPRWPHKSSHFVQLGLGIAALIAAIVIVADNGEDDPVSP